MSDFAISDVCDCEAMKFYKKHKAYIEQLLKDIGGPPTKSESDLVNSEIPKIEITEGSLPTSKQASLEEKIRKNSKDLGNSQNLDRKDLDLDLNDQDDRSTDSQPIKTSFTKNSKSSSKSYKKFKFSDVVQKTIISDHSFSIDKSDSADFENLKNEKNSLRKKSSTNLSGQLEGNIFNSGYKVDDDLLVDFDTPNQSDNDHSDSKLIEIQKKSVEKGSMSNKTSRSSVNSLTTDIYAAGDIITSKPTAPFGKVTIEIDTQKSRSPRLEIVFEKGKNENFKGVKSIEIKNLNTHEKIGDGKKWQKKIRPTPKVFVKEQSRSKQTFPEVKKSFVPGRSVTLTPSVENLLFHLEQKDVCLKSIEKEKLFLKSSPKIDEACQANIENLVKLVDIGCGSHIIYEGTDLPQETLDVYKHFFKQPTGPDLRALDTARFDRTSADCSTNDLISYVDLEEKPNTLKIPQDSWNISTETENIGNMSRIPKNIQTSDKTLQDLAAEAKYIQKEKDLKAKNLGNAEKILTELIFPKVSNEKSLDKNSEEFQKPLSSRERKRRFQKTTLVDACQEINLPDPIDVQKSLEEFKGGLLDPIKGDQTAEISEGTLESVQNLGVQNADFNMQKNITAIGGSLSPDLTEGTLDNSDSALQNLGVQQNTLSAIGGLLSPRKVSLKIPELDPKIVGGIAKFSTFSAEDSEFLEKYLEKIRRLEGDRSFQQHVVSRSDRSDRTLYDIKEIEKEPVVLEVYTQWTEDQNVVKPPEIVLQSESHGQPQETWTELMKEPDESGKEPTQVKKSFSEKVLAKLEEDFSDSKDLLKIGEPSERNQAFVDPSDIKQIYKEPSKNIALIEPPSIRNQYFEMPSASEKMQVLESKTPSSRMEPVGPPSDRNQAFGESTVPSHDVALDFRPKSNQEKPITPSAEKSSAPSTDEVKKFKPTSAEKRVYLPPDPNEEFPFAPNTENLPKAEKSKKLQKFVPPSRRQLPDTPSTEKQIIPLSAERGPILPPTSGTRVVLPPSSGTGVILPPSSGTGVILPPSSGTGVILPPSSGTGVTLPPSSGTGVILPPSAGVVLPSSTGTGVTLPSTSGAGVKPTSSQKGVILPPTPEKQVHITPSQRDQKARGVISEKSITPSGKNIVFDTTSVKSVKKTPECCRKQLEKDMASKKSASSVISKQTTSKYISFTSLRGRTQSAYSWSTSIYSSPWKTYSHAGSVDSKMFKRVSRESLKKKWKTSMSQIANVLIKSLGGLRKSLSESALSQYIKHGRILDIKDPLSFIKPTLRDGKKTPKSTEQILKEAEKKLEKYKKEKDRADYLKTVEAHRRKAAQEMLDALHECRKKARPFAKQGSRIDTYLQPAMVTPSCHVVQGLKDDDSICSCFIEEKEDEPKEIKKRPPGPPFNTPDNKSQKSLESESEVEILVVDEEPIDPRTKICSCKERSKIEVGTISGSSWICYKGQVLKGQGILPSYTIFTGSQDLEPTGTAPLEFQDYPVKSDKQLLFEFYESQWEEEEDKEGSTSYFGLDSEGTLFEDFESNASEFPESQIGVDQEFISENMREAKQYLVDHRIEEVFRYLNAQLLVNVPDNPIEFLINLLESCLQYRDCACVGCIEPPLIFGRKHIESLFNSMSKFNPGYVTIEQYKTAMFTLNLQEFNPHPDISQEGLVSKEIFTNEALMALTTHLDEILRPQKTESTRGIGIHRRILKPKKAPIQKEAKSPKVSKIVPSTKNEEAICLPPKVESQVISRSRSSSTSSSTSTHVKVRFSKSGRSVSSRKTQTSMTFDSEIFGQYTPGDSQNVSNITLASKNSNKSTDSIVKVEEYPGSRNVSGRKSTRFTLDIDEIEKPADTPRRSTRFTLDSDQAPRRFSIDSDEFGNPNDLLSDTQKSDEDIADDRRLTIATIATQTTLSYTSSSSGAFGSEEELQVHDVKIENVPEPEPEPEPRKEASSINPQKSDENSAPDGIADVEKS